MSFLPTGLRLDSVMLYSIYILRMSATGEYVDILKNCHNADTIRVVFDDGIMKQRSKTILPSRFVNIRKNIQDLKRKRTELYREYYDLYERLVNLNMSLTKSQQSEFNELAKRIGSLDEDLDNLRIAYDTRAKQGAPREAISMLQRLGKESEGMYKNANVYDLSVPKRLSDITHQCLKLYSEIKQHSHDTDIDYNMEAPGRLLKKGASPVKEDREENKSKKDTTKPRKKPIKKVANQRVTNSEKNAIKKNVKDLIKNTFTFKTKEECASQKRSQPFYESKDAIVEKISKNEELKKLMPSNYKSLSKEKICAELLD
jgi:hypothetical protein